MPPFWSIMPLLLGSSDIEPLVLHNQAPFNMPPIFFQHACRMLHSTWLYMLHFNLHHAPITCRKFPFNMHHAPKICRMLQFMRKNDMPLSSFNIPKPPSNMPPNSTYTAMPQVPCSIRYSSRSSHMSRIMLQLSQNVPERASALTRFNWICRVFIQHTACQWIGLHMVKYRLYKLIMYTYLLQKLYMNII